MHGFVVKKLNSPLNAIADWIPVSTTLKSHRVCAAQLAMQCSVIVRQLDSPDLYQFRVNFLVPVKCLPHVSMCNSWQCSGGRATACTDAMVSQKPCRPTVSRLWSCVVHAHFALGTPYEINHAPPDNDGLTTLREMQCTDANATSPYWSAALCKDVMWCPAVA